MKHYQITEELFFMLARYHLLGQEDEREEIEMLLQSKVDAMINRSLYSQYKTADSPAEQEKARQEYLDRKGYFPSFRW
ncbi:complexin-2 [Anaerorhabdus sp.]|uniref:complexin-2 n=1 Tax=Anaerorhabdus sp. TaxID=1872524 RepID=UPI002FC946F6